MVALTRSLLHLTRSAVALIGSCFINLTMSGVGLTRYLLQVSRSIGCLTRFFFTKNKILFFGPAPLLL